MMNFQQYDSADDFAQAAMPFLEKNEDKFSLFLGVLQGIQQGNYENPFMASIQEEGELLALFQMTPPTPTQYHFCE